MTRIHLLYAVLLLFLLGCARRQKQPLLYQACWIGPYTKDAYCGNPKTLSKANMELAEDILATGFLDVKRFVRPARRFR